MTISESLGQKIRRNWNDGSGEHVRTVTTNSYFLCTKFPFSCPLLSAFLCYRLASSLFVTCDILDHFGSFQSRCASSGWKYPLFPEIVKIVDLFFGNTHLLP